MKTFNSVLAILAVLAIVALSAFNVHKVGEQAEMIAELQQYHQVDVPVDTTNYLDYSPSIWESVEQAIEFRKEDVTWLQTLEKWRNMPEISLRHILQHHGLQLGIEDIVRIYESNIAYYAAYEEGYLTPKLPDPLPNKAKPDKKSAAISEVPIPSGLLEDSIQQIMCLGAPKGASSEDDKPVGRKQMHSRAKQRIRQM